LAVPRSIRDAAQKSFADHVADISRNGCSAMHVYNVQRRLKKLADECGWQQLRDVDADSFLKWRSKQPSLAPKTLHDYWAAVGAFYHWLDVVGRADVNPLRRVRPVQTRGAEKRQRRALTPEQLGGFIQAVGNHALVFFVAINTGMRRGELAALAWGDVRLGDEPEIRLRASTTKNGKSARQPLWKITAGMLVKARPADADEATPVFSKRGLPTMEQHRAYPQKQACPIKTRWAASWISTPCATPSIPCSRSPGRPAPKKRSDAAQ
jgi:integrase